LKAYQYYFELVAGQEKVMGMPSGLASGLAEVHKKNGGLHIPQKK
jgi:hypothetical protein